MSLGPSGHRWSNYGSGRRKVPEWQLDIEKLDMVEVVVWVELERYLKFAEMYVLHWVFWQPMFDRIVPGYIPGVGVRDG